MPKISDKSFYSSSLVVNLFKKGWANRWIRNAMIFIMVLTPLMILDQVSKGVVFNGDTSGRASATLGDWKFIGFRSQFHTSTTFLDFIGKSLPLWASLLIDYVLVAIFVALVATSTTKFQAIATSISLTGILGNTIDASALQGVRNVFFLPWADRGTFNFADITIVVGAALTALSFIIMIFKKDKKPKIEIVEVENLQVGEPAAPAVSAEEPQAKDSQT